MQVKPGDTVIYFGDETTTYDPTYKYKDSNIGIVQEPHPDCSNSKNAWWALWGKNESRCWFDSDSSNFFVIPKEQSTNNEAIDELCDLLVEACNEGHSLMQTKTLRRVQMQLKALGKPMMRLKN